MQEVLIVSQDWRIGLLDILALIVFSVVVLLFIFDYLKRKKTINGRHKAILKYLGETGKITTSEVSRLLKVSEDTALRELTKLVEMKVLCRGGSGRSVYYAKR